MRLRSLLLEHYGNFQRLDLQLDPAPGRINLVEARNGAGKSVIREAFHDLLFGIDSKTAFLFDRFKGERPNLLAEAVLQDGEGLVFGSRYKLGRVLPDADLAAPIRLSGALSRVTPTQLKHLFALDTLRLREGGRELASGGDTLGMALLAGTGELTFAKTVRDGLARRRDGLWEAGKTSRSLHRANMAVEKSRKALRDAIRQPRQQQQQVAELRANQDALSAARQAHAQAAEAARRLARIDQTRPALAELAVAVAWLAANPDAPALPQELSDELAAARQAVTLTQAGLAAAERQATERHAAIHALQRDEPAEAVEQHLGKLAEQLGEIEKNAVDSRRLRGECDQLHADIAATMRDIGAPAGADPATLVPSVAAVVAVRNLITSHAAIRDAAEGAQARLAAAQDDLSRLGEAEDPSGSRADAALVSLLQEVRADGDPVRRLAEAAGARRLGEAQAAVALAAVPGWTGGLAALANLAPPLDAAIDRLAAAVTTAQALAADACAKRDRLGQDRAGWQRQLEALRTTPLPDEAAIAAERAARDAGWRLIFTRAFTTALPDEAAEALYGEGEPLPLRFERHLRAADALADRRLLELPRVTEAERLARELVQTDAEWTALGEESRAARNQAAAAQAAWAEACRWSGARPDSTAGEFRVFLAKRTDAMRAAGAAAELRAGYEALATAQDGFAARLSSLLGQPEGGLSGLLAEADAQAAAATEAEGQRIEHRTRLENARTRLEAAQSDVGRNRQRRQHWDAEWARALLALGRPPAEPPAATEVVLRSLDALKGQVDALRGLSGRLRAMEDDTDQFAATVNRLAEQLSLPRGADTFATARALIARRLAARDVNSAWQQADQARREADRQFAEELAAVQHARAVLDGVVAACGAQDPEAAEHRLLRSRDRSHHEAMRANAEATLRQHGAGLPVPLLQEQADAVPVDRMEAERVAAEQALSEARARAETAAVELSQAEARSKDASRSEDAIDASVAQTAAFAAQGRLLEDFLMLSVASEMLAQALLEVERASGGTGLHRISAAFGALTNGAYSLVGSAPVPAGKNKAGQIVLQAVEAAFPNELRDIAELSEGTRDQLYLALRLVAIEDYVAASAPLPFIADDVLQTFDDARARAALEALVGLSHHVQVVVLTHHPHLLQLAGDLPVHVQRL